MKARKLNVPVWHLLGGQVREKVAVYAWIGGDRPSDIESAAKARLAQGFKAVKMNATEDIGWLDSPESLKASVERLKTVKALGMDAALDFHGRLHKPMAKQLAGLLEPHGPLFIEEPLLSEHPEGIKQISELTNCPIALGERLYSRWDVKRFLEGSGPVPPHLDDVLTQYQITRSTSCNLTSHTSVVSQRSRRSLRWQKHMMVSYFQYKRFETCLHIS